VIYVYTENITNRLQYIVETLGHISGIHFNLVKNIDKFNDFNGAKINYTSKIIDNCLHINPVSLLFEKEILKQDIKVEKVDFPIFFKTNGDYPFDIFAASFYIISRYEEYLPHKKDEHGRYLASNSIAYQHDFLKIPIINIWINDLLKRFPKLSIPKKEFKFIPTFDVDVAYYAFYTKGIIRGSLSLAKNVLSLNAKELKLQLNILKKKVDDPYDTYEKIFEFNKKYNLNPIFFTHMGTYGKFDKNISCKSKRFKELIQNISMHANIGIHPSYLSNKNIALLKKELNRLQELTNKTITKSRQHYLILSMPSTYRNLIKLGISEDYSMGYSDEVGFRAGTCSPFQFYNLENEKKTSLIVYPFAYMDGTINEYHKYNFKEAEEIIIKLINEVKKVNGTFISIWHNSSFNETNQWKGWDDFYDKTLNYVN